MGRTFRRSPARSRFTTAVVSTFAALGLAVAPALPMWNATTGTMTEMDNPLMGAASAQSTRFDVGHVDAFNVTAENGGLMLDLKEDITGSHVRHDPANVILGVKAQAFTNQGQNIPQVGAAGYLLPMTQDHNLLWPGWDTLGVQGYEFSAVDIEFTNVAGPGRVFMFGAGLGGVNSLLKDGSLELTSGAVRQQDYPAHTHANWLFEKSGRYTMTVQASAKNSSGQIVKSEPKTYTWVVDHSDEDPNPAGSGGDGGAARGNPGGNAGGGTGGNTGGGTGGNSAGNSGSNRGSASGSGTASSASTPQGKAGNNNAASGAAGSAAGNAAEQCTQGEPGLRPLIKDDRQSPPKWVSPPSVTFGMGNGAKVQLPQKLGPIAQGEAWQIGATQQPGVPWLGVNTMHPNLLSKTTGDVTFSLTSYEGPGNMYVYEQGNLGQVVGAEWFTGSNGRGSGSHVVPRNSHVHPNWVFDKPGTYRVGVTQTATTKEGKKVSAPATLTFAVGGNGGNATSGHFDFGAEITEDGNCAGGGAAGADGSGAGGSGAATNADGSLADTGASQMTLALLIAGLGIAVLGGGLLTYLRSMDALKR